MKKNYFEQVKADVERWIEDNNSFIFDFDEYKSDRDGAEMFLNDQLFCEDSITGNASGSYTFNRSEAREYVLADMDTVKEALSEFCVPSEEIGERFLNEDWEYLDVTARCFVLGQAISAVLDELEADGAFDEDEEEDEEAKQD